MPRIEEPKMPIMENEKSDIRGIEIIIKQPKAKEEGDCDKETEIYNAWHEEGIKSLMEAATKAENIIMRWFEENRNTKINEEQENNIAEYRKAQDAVNQKVEEVYGKMKGVKIVETEVCIGVKEF